MWRKEAEKGEEKGPIIPVSSQLKRPYLDTYLEYPTSLGPDRTPRSLQPRPTIP